MNTFTETSPHGTSLQGHITADFYELKEIFGEPKYIMDDDTHVEWDLYDKETELVFTIYDRKSYCKRPDANMDWKVGGLTNEALQLVLKQLESYRNLLKESEKC